VVVNTRTLKTSALQIRANQLDLLSRLAEDIAHEIKNPLHAIVINLELLKTRLAEGKAESAQERADALREEVARLQIAVDGLLALVRSGPGGGDGVSLRTALRELGPALELQCRLTGVELTVEAPPADDHVGIAPEALRHMILSLVSNALRAMRSGGELELAVTRVRTEIALSLRGTGLAFTAEDVAGRSAADIPAPGSPGAALAFASQIAAEAGGRIELEDPGGHAQGPGIRLVLPRTSGA
jgi:signal transduction histidine kinase